MPRVAKSTTTGARRIRVLSPAQVSWKTNQLWLQNCNLCSSCANNFCSTNQSARGRAAAGIRRTRNTLMVEPEVGVVLREGNDSHRRRYFLALLAVAPSVRQPRPVRARLASDPVRPSTVFASLINVRSEMRRTSEPTLVPTLAVRLPARRRTAPESSKLLLAKILTAWAYLVKAKNANRELMRTVNERIRQSTMQRAAASPMRISRLRRLQTQSERRIHSQRRQEEQEEAWQINRRIARDRDNSTSNVKPRKRQPTLFATRASSWAPMKAERAPTCASSSSSSTASVSPTLTRANNREDHDDDDELNENVLAVEHEEVSQVGPLLSAKAKQRFRDRGAVRQPLRRSKARRAAVHELTEETLRTVAAQAALEQAASAEA